MTACSKQSTGSVRQAPLSPRVAGVPIFRYVPTKLPKLRLHKLFCDDEGMFNHKHFNLSLFINFITYRVHCEPFLMNPSSCRRLGVRLAHRRPSADLVRVRGRGALRLTVVPQLPPRIPQAQQGHQVGISFATSMYPILNNLIQCF